MGISFIFPAFSEFPESSPPTVRYSSLGYSSVYWSFPLYYQSQLQLGLTMVSRMEMRMLGHSLQTIRQDEASVILFAALGVSAYSIYMSWWCKDKYNDKFRSMDLDYPCLPNRPLGLRSDCLVQQCCLRESRLTHRSAACGSSSVFGNSGGSIWFGHLFLAKCSPRTTSVFLREPTLYS